MSGYAPLLLISSSRVHGTGYLDHAETEIRDYLRGCGRVLFVPYAVHEHDAYAQLVAERFAAMGFVLESIHASGDVHRAVESAEAVFVGGGNTFRLLKALYDLDLLDVIRRRVAAGMRYMGSSAGSNVACPTIRTTNDMPIVEPPSFQALGLFPYQVNPHYIDADSASTHMGETCEQRLMEYLEENKGPVIGLREGAMLRVTANEVVVRGARGARIFRRGQPAYEVGPGATLQL
jgi:dipeptidase E